jgi:hypothetical protein
MLCSISPRVRFAPAPKEFCNWLYTIRDIYGLNRLIGLYFYEIVNPSALSNEFVMLPEGAAAPQATQLASRTLSSSGGSYRFAWNSM